MKQEEVPPNVYYAHYKNVEKSMLNGKFDPTAGLSSSGIAGTGADKEEEDANKPANTDEEIKDVSKKEGGKCAAMICPTQDSRKPLIGNAIFLNIVLLFLSLNIVLINFLFLRFMLCFVCCCNNILQTYNVKN